ncbi:5-oxoprolinase subunit B family protein [Vibrio navarrensis]|uniref:5-oxoprolinase subunit B family protein n=1 Tax=Vibrio navarrensis TaxID=29495 RepID=UPI00186970E8|nr:carboxyltransferase domain-containing protein [Vibrio navarrensis]MBE4574826.1 allophanate hydrolase [Vibrio navarrensis]MBE4607772.1 allophanate hydrolase [Vibrio navarrensis]MBE4611150.1 allophanate hydrolase [Vibrio navarrensis]
MKSNCYRIQPVSECSLMVHFAESVNEQQVGELANLIRQTLPNALMNVVPAYRSILVEYLPFRLSESQLLLQLEQLLQSSQVTTSVQAGRNHRLPVYYAKQTALDLETFLHRGLSLDDVVELHSETPYTVSAIGFTPGFAFLSDVDERLAVPRLASPRVSVPAGSVAIAESKTAIYPSATPGGWNIIGQCPVSVYNPNEVPVTPFTIGDTVTFYPISEQEYLELGGTL